MWRIVFSLLLFLSSSGANASKCPFWHYVVRGVVSSQINLAPLEDRDLRIHLFLGSRPYSSDYPLSRKEDYVSPAVDGRFEIDAWASNDINGWFRRCSTKPLHGMLVISGVGIMSTRLPINFMIAEGPHHFIQNKKISIEVVPVD